MHIRGNTFVDEFERSLILRGVNLGGDSKIPLRPDGRTHVRENFYDGRSVSFVGRPFPLAEADDHFSRLARWGQRFIRFLVTWEAIEHEGPGMYDAEYLDYVEALVDKAGHHGISLFIDPHQDVWSRWTGGDGAPKWTLEALGFEPENFHASGAALLHQEMKASYPRMEWFSNNLRLACATMFTLFFAGNDYAPGIEKEGIPIQEYLQSHYINSIAQLARRLEPYPNVVGFDSLNEPGDGFIGIPDIANRRADLVLPGLAPSPWDAMLAGEGYPALVDRIGVRGLGLKVVGREILGTTGVMAWKEGIDCLWRRVGVWDIGPDGPRLIEPAWFASPSHGRKDAAKAGHGGQVSIRETEHFAHTYLKPFILRFASAMRRSAKNPERYAIFIEGSPSGKNPAWSTGELPRKVNASHWYDAFTLSLKRWTGFIAFDTEKSKPVLGPFAVRRYFAEAIRRIAAHSREAMGDSPSIVGEFGLPFDLNDRIGFRTGRYRLHEEALAAYYNALDTNLMNGTLWNYTASNTHEFGDGWNNEDLSVYSADDSGGRGLRGFVRPYAMAIAGKPVKMSFNMNRGLFCLSWIPDSSIRKPTEIYVPHIQFPKGYTMSNFDCAAVEIAHDGGLYSIIECSPDPGATMCRIELKSRK
jgi:hypothetical protein